MALLPAGARANATDDRIIQDCQTSVTGALTGSYTKTQLRHAYRNLPGDVLEYSGCPDAIKQAILDAARRGGPDGGGDGAGPTGAGGTGGTSGSGGTDAGAGTDASAGAAPPPATPPHRGTEAPVQIAGTLLEPGELPSIGQDANPFPTALAVLLVLLGVAALAPAALTIGRRVLGRRRA